MPLDFQQTLAVIGALGVIISLIYTAIQLRRNTRALRAQTYLQVTGEFAEIWNGLGANPELCDLVIRGNDNFDTLNRIEKARFRFALMAYFRQFENAYFLHKINILKEQDWLAIADDIDNIFAAPGARTAWPLIKMRSSAEFQSYVQPIVDRHAKS
jgi:hypothetical protein